jgi:hypothetical protein
MFRVQIPQLNRNADEDDQRLSELDRKGTAIEEQYQRLKEEDRQVHQRNAERFTEYNTKGDHEALQNLHRDQIKFDADMKKKLEKIYKDERELRIEATIEIRARRQRLIQLAEEASQSSGQRRDHLQQILLPKPRVNWPDVQPPKAPMWNSPPPPPQSTGSDDRMQVEGQKRSREGESIVKANVQVKIAPVASPPRTLGVAKVPTFKVPPNPKPKRTSNAFSP